jgi:hypothetical protein
MGIQSVRMQDLQSKSTKLAEHFQFGLTAEELSILQGSERKAQLKNHSVQPLRKQTTLLRAPIDMVTSVKELLIMPQTANDNTWD